MDSESTTEKRRYRKILHQSKTCMYNTDAATQYLVVINTQSFTESCSPVRKDVLSNANDFFSCYLVIRLSLY